MFRFLRNSHLLLGLFFCPFILLFGVSSVQFAHNDWFVTEPESAEMTVTVDPAQATSPRALGRLLMDQQGYRGFVLDIEEKDDGFEFLIGRMGTIHEIDYKTGSPEVAVTKKVWPLISLLTWMHTTFGMDHEFGPHNFWGFLMFLTSVALLLLGATGIYLWFKIHAERLAGLVLISVSLAFGLTMIALLRFP
ncbi:MAG: PepSY domain-containing protein [Acidobacteria bacterium]|nr:PepSY domain-containing protein [Acidobacteriota bacterium]